jgi:hypothetical protein
MKSKQAISRNNEEMMIKVYRIKSDVNKYQYFLPEKEEDESRLWMDCSSKGDTWLPPPVFVYKPIHKKGDFYSFNSSAIITSPKATQVLYPFLEAAGELLPLTYKGEQFTLLNVTECIDCLYHQKTEWVQSKDAGENLWINKYVFHTNRFSESDIFKIPETCKSEILVVEGLKDPKDEFKHAIESAGLEGMIFEEVWHE